MKLIAASIQNFRLLKDVKLSFSANSDKPLTVVRAANETGKTTCLTALTWCLYGSSTLPNKGEYVLFPSDEVKNGKRSIEVSVEISFELEHAIKIHKEPISIVRSQYRMKRTCIEEAPVNGKPQRSNEIVDLWKITPSGTERVIDSEVSTLVNKALPQSLKDVYFTDGDRAMSFIEAAASQGVKRRRVTNAIESLLGLKVLENTISHLNTVANQFSKEIDNKDYKAELERLTDRITSYTEDIEENQKILEEANEKILEIEKEVETKKRQIEQALTLGDKDALVVKKRRLQSEIRSVETTVDESFKSLLQLVSDEEVSNAILSSRIKDAKQLLNQMNEVQQLPRISVPILEEILDQEKCFCGTDLDNSSAESVQRRSYIKETIKASRESDKVQTAATSLFYGIRSTQTDDSGKKWCDRYANKFRITQSAQKTLINLQQELDELDDQIAQIDDTELQKLREQQDNLNRSLQSYQDRRSVSNSKIEHYQSLLNDAQEELQKVRRKLGKLDNSTLHWDIALHTKQIFEDIVTVLRLEELKKVSSEMNRIFLSMIGADSNNPDFQLIQGAELTDEFDIVVYGPNKHILNPDQDLNGASRRAITLAFILALTKVSQVEAPNIIDTPLGMMSGYVKQSVLLRTIEEGSQVILFLTHDEIRGVEEIIDKYAGSIFTLTNPAHYPKMLKHKPSSFENGIIRCECNHRSHCEACERKSVEVA